jgi:hypothetical protein
MLLLVLGFSVEGHEMRMRSVFSQNVRFEICILGRGSFSAVTRKLCLTIICGVVALFRSPIYRVVMRQLLV